MEESYKVLFFCNKTSKTERKVAFGLTLYFNPFPLSVVFHIETSRLFCSTKQMTGFYLKLNTGLK